MSNSIIRVENLGKKYSIHHENHERYVALRDVMANAANRLKQQLTSAHQSYPQSREDFWALQDISFEVRQGDRVGIIGRNGAGKSTLLKVLSRITEPTKGCIRLRGRVASLLEVGTGFHPELTGRENIFLNGAILGMCRQEIRQKFDEIVAFSEVEKFLDTPVKRYSSGMYVRLAFAVAAHLEPEILIVDEVLAVGDAQFQKKCLGKMKDVGKEGRTVIFVSHSMSAVQTLCSRGIVLGSGNVLLDGSSDEAIDLYLGTGSRLACEVPISQRADRSGSGRVKVVDIKILDGDSKPVESLKSGEDYCFSISCINQTNSKIDNIVLSFDIFDERGNRVLLFRTTFTNEFISVNSGLNFIECRIQELPITLGKYRTSVFISHADREVFDHIKDASSFSVEGGNFFGTGSIGLPNHCKILTKVDWLHTGDNKAPSDDIRTRALESHIQP